MAEAVLLPQPRALPLAGELSLTELADFVPSEIGIEGQFEQALHQFAVMSFRWAVRNLMSAAQTEDAGLRNTHRELANRYAERSAKFARELQLFRRTTNPLAMDAERVANVAVDAPVLFNAIVGPVDVTALAAMSVIVAPAILPDTEL